VCISIFSSLFQPDVDHTLQLEGTSVVIMLAWCNMSCEVDFIPLECPDYLNVNTLGILVACQHVKEVSTKAVEILISNMDMVVCQLTILSC